MRGRGEEGVFVGSNWIFFLGQLSLSGSPYQRQSPSPRLKGSFIKPICNPGQETWILLAEFSVFSLLDVH